MILHLSFVELKGEGFFEPPLHRSRVKKQRPKAVENWPWPASFPALAGREGRESCDFYRNGSLKRRPALTDLIGAVQQQP
jgi:hypothetical protein